jgi:hypothetical protein
VPYGQITGDTAIATAAKRILTLGEKGSEDAYAMAAEWIADAQSIFCLGFGYHREVIKGLKLNDPARTLGIFGTCQGYTDSEVSHLISARFDPRTFHELTRDVTIRPLPGRAPGPADSYVRSNLGLIL